MDHAAVIIFKRCTLPKLLKFFVKPGICRSIEINNGEDEITVHMLECPVFESYTDNRKTARIVKNLCVEKNIRFFIGKNTEYYLGSGLEYLENSLERGNTEEVKGIKGLAALIKLSVDSDTSYLKRNMCFAGVSYSCGFIGAISEEAAGIFIYEYPGMKESCKKEIFEQLMADKGISAVFTKDLGKAVLQSDIVLADESVELEAYKADLAGKLLVGSNTVSGNFKKVSCIHLWHESLEGLTEDNPLVSLNDELLGVLRHFYREKGLVSFLRRFPYICMY